LLIDEQLKPWLIEVNASPSLTCTTEEDRKLKDRVMRDALAVAVPPGKLEAAAGGVSRTTALSRLSRGGRSGVGGDKGAVGGVRTGVGEDGRCAGVRLGDHGRAHRRERRCDGAEGKVRNDPGSVQIAAIFFSY